MMLSIDVWNLKFHKSDLGIDPVVVKFLVKNFVQNSILRGHRGTDSSKITARIPRCRKRFYEREKFNFGDLKNAP